MKSFMVLFSGLKNGWVGHVSTYTLTIPADSKEEALTTIYEQFQQVNVRTVRELKPAKI